MLILCSRVFFTCALRPPTTRLFATAGLLLGLTAHAGASALPWPVRNVNSYVPTGDAIALNAGDSATYQGQYALENSYLQIQAVAVMNPSVLAAELSSAGATTNVLLRGIKPGIAAVKLSAPYRDYSQQNPDGSWGVLITNTISYGVLIRTATGKAPGLPTDYKPLGSRAIMGTAAVEKWYQDGEGLDARRTDIVDIYMQGGPASWVYQNSNWDANWYPGKYLYHFIRACKRQGRIPCVVFYCIPPAGMGDSAEGAIRSVSEAPGILASDVNRYGGDPNHPWQTTELVAQTNYMSSYYHRTIRVMREILQRTTSDGWPCLLVIEPDFIGYMSANLGNPVDPNATNVAVGANNYSFKVSRAFEQGPSESITVGANVYTFSTNPLLDASEQDQFPNTLKGFVTSIPHIFRKQFVLDGATVQLGANIMIGWKLNIWASKTGGGYGGNIYKPVAGTPFGVGKGIIRWTDAAGQGAAPNRFGDIVQWLREEAAGIADYYVSTGITNRTDYLFMDRYGVDAASKGFIEDPAASTWFWNHDHWNNFLAFAESVQQHVALPIILWQMPMGHINTTTAQKPDGIAYALLSNAANSGCFEDSSATFWFGDTFAPGNTNRAAYFALNRWAEVDAQRAGDVTVANGQINWAPALDRFGGLHIAALLSGPGVGRDASTFACAQDTAATADDYWWINQAQRYYHAVGSWADNDLFTPACADYDGDGVADPAVYHNASGVWYIRLSASAYELYHAQFGEDGCIPCGTDYDGDGKTDPAVYHRPTGNWQIKLSDSGYSDAWIIGFGGSNYEPIAADYDGDTKADPGVYNAINGNVHVYLSGHSYKMTTLPGFGGLGYTPVQAHYESDQRDDMAVYHTANGDWTVLLSAENWICTRTLYGFGGAGYSPIKGDFTGSGLNNPAVYQKSTGNWYFKVLLDGAYITAGMHDFGGDGFLATAADLDGDGKADPTLFEKATGMWYIKSSLADYRIVPFPSGYTP